MTTTTQLVAWGFVDQEMTPQLFQELRTQIRRELRPYHLLIKGEYRGSVTIKKRREAVGLPKYAARKQRLHTGTLQDCCKMAMHVIDPENYQDPRPVWDDNGGWQHWSNPTGLKWHSK